MILSQNELVNLFPDVEALTLVRRMAAIEAAIRSNTNNNFQQREIRVTADIVNGKIKGTNPNLRVDDTVMISKGVSKGLYTIKSINDGEIEVNEPIFDSKNNIITKVFYPADVIQGCLELLDWDMSEAAEKVRAGVQSETISRHSVSYGNLSDTATLSAYPSYLLGFLTPYRKPTF